MLGTFIIIAYLTCAFITHCGVEEEYNKDDSGDLDNFSPFFIKVCIIGASMLWPVLVVAATIKHFKDKKGV